MSQTEVSANILFIISKFNSKVWDTYVRQSTLNIRFHVECTFA